MAENTDKLLARADAVVAEAKRLTDLNLWWQHHTSDRLYGMFSRFSAFRASERKPHYPTRFIQQRLQSAPPIIAEAERDIALGEQHLARQEAGVAERDRDDHNPHQAKEVLATPWQSQVIHLELASIIRELNELRTMCQRSVHGEA